MLLNFSVVSCGFPSDDTSEFRNWEIGRSQFFPFALVCAMKECAYLLLTAPVVHPEILNIFLSLDYHSTIKWQQRCMGEHFIFVLGLSEVDIMTFFHKRNLMSGSCLVRIYHTGIFYIILAEYFNMSNCGWRGQK